MTLKKINLFMYGLAIAGDVVIAVLEPSRSGRAFWLVLAGTYSALFALIATERSVP